jgi:hypothetical protein
MSEVWRENSKLERGLQLNRRAIGGVPPAVGWSPAGRRTIGLNCSKELTNDPQARIR